MAIPKSAKRPRKHRKSMDMDEDDEYSENWTPRSRSQSNKLEVRWSNLKLPGLNNNESNQSISSDLAMEHKYDDSMDSLEFDMNASRKKRRRWSRELEVGLKNAVEDAMTDGITEMFDKLKTDPNSSILQTMQIRMRAARQSNAVYAQMLQDDITSPLSTDIPIKGTWVE